MVVTRIPEETVPVFMTVDTEGNCVPPSTELHVEEDHSEDECEKAPESLALVLLRVLTV